MKKEEDQAASINVLVGIKTTQEHITSTH